MLFGYFLHDAKSDNPFLCREHRGSANLESAHPNNNFPLTKLKPFPKGASRFCKPRISPQNKNFAQTQLNPLPLRGNSYFLLGTKSRKKSLCPIRGSTLRVLCAAASRHLSAASPLLLPPYGGVPAGTAHSVCFFFAACGGFIFVAAATNFAASREYACSASINAGKSNAFAGISHKFLISFL